MHFKTSTRSLELSAMYNEHDLTFEIATTIPRILIIYSHNSLFSMLVLIVTYCSIRMM